MAQMIENQMEKKMDNEMENGVTQALYRDQIKLPGMQGLGLKFR